MQGQKSRGGVGGCEGEAISCPFSHLKKGGTVHTETHALANSKETVCPQNCKAYNSLYLPSALIHSPKFCLKPAGKRKTKQKLI